MSLSSNSSCLICGTELDFGEDTLLIKSRQEICFKFNTLVSRFLNLTSTSTNCSSTLNTTCNNFNGESVCCLSCLSVIESFCDTYKNWESLQLELFHILRRISSRMTSLSSPNSYQTDFKTKVESKRQRHYPYVQLKRLNVNELEILKNQSCGGTLIKSEDVEVQDEDLSDFPDFSDQVEESVAAVESNPDEVFEKTTKGERNLKHDLKKRVTINDAGDNETQDFIAIVSESNIPPEPESSKKSKPTTVRNECFLCKKTFLSGRDLIRHTGSHTFEKPHHCRLCQREFRTQFLLYRHRKSHHLAPGSKPLTTACKICGTVVRDIPKHIARAHGPINWTCSFCGKGFTHVAEFKRHEISHSQERNFSCDVCNKKFKHESELRQHKRSSQYFDCVNNGGKVQCDICKKLVMDIRSHRLYLHASVRKAVCEICGKGFVSQCQLKKHQNSHHSDQGHTNISVQERQE